MFRSEKLTIFSATDLSSHSECEHRTVLELAALLGGLERPGKNELSRELLELRGLEHEKRVLELLARGDKRVSRVNTPSAQAGGRAAALAETERAMQSGADIIYQGALAHGAWLGRPDFLLRAPGSSRFGDFRYEVVDAKLARETRARAVLQLCVYTELLTVAQGVAPERFWIAPGTQPLRLEPLRADEYMAYYRRVRRELEVFVADTRRAAPYPEPVEHCQVCPWWKRCEDRRRDDDHLSLVAGITRRQRERLHDARIERVAALGALPKSASVPGIRDEALARVREQARLQVAGRDAGRALFELLPRAEERAGLELLPEPSPGDMFLDLEGDPFVLGDGLEYLFGLLELGVADDFGFGSAEPAPPKYHAHFATTRAEERRAFEAVVERIARRRAEFPSMHVYHFGHRENEALKRLASRHATCTDAIDEWLRAGVLIDLHRVTRQAIRASVESYSLKQLESLYGFARRVELRKAAAAMQHFVWWLETGEGTRAEPTLRELIQRYNEDDCASTLALRDWLEQRRPELARAAGQPLRRPLELDGKASDKRSLLNAETEAVSRRLLAGLAEDPAEDDAQGRARRLLAYVLSWHQRELRPAWWEYFRVKDVPAEERVEDRAALGELRYLGSIAKIRKSLVHRYEFPEQEHAIRNGKRRALDAASEAEAGEVLEVSASHIHLLRGEGSKLEHPRALIPSKPVMTAEQESSLRKIGARVAEHGLYGSGEHRAARSLLLRAPPRVGMTEGAPLVRSGESAAEAITRLALALDESVLAVQGPPGSGKTTAAASMIVALVRAGKRVGVTASSHKVILHLLEKARERALALGVPLRAWHMGEESDGGGSLSGLTLSKDYERIGALLRAGELDLVGGTAWAWSREQFAGLLDVLVVDEAGQVSLANALAVSPSAKSLVLLGDPAQLEQPQRGVHPPGSAVSALEHVLGDAGTMPPELGVFMPHTHRLHPAICRFTSRAFYDGLLAADAELGRQRVLGAGTLAGSGLRFVPVEHRGNTNHSPEEVERVVALTRELFAGQPRYVARDGAERVLEPSDVLIVAPYNVQVSALQQRLPDFRVGTVDKFQGQEAPIVIYSMATSSAEDAPRGMEFLFSLNRLNVATSRAQALVAIVASPELARARCRTPRQMRLVSALCTFLEMVDDGA